jgi:hypothetical protein
MAELPIEHSLSIYGQKARESKRIILKVFERVTT